MDDGGENYHWLIGCGSLTWPRDMDRDQVWAEIRDAGYDGLPVGPGLGSSVEVLARCERFSLKPAPGYLSGNFWKPEEEADILARAETYGAFIQAVGCTELYLGPGGFEGYVTASGLNRRQLAGHVRAEDMMTDDEFEQFAKAVNTVGEITLKYGVRSCFHNHVGSVIETREEIDRLFGMVDRDLVYQGPDIGHLLWAGADPVQFCEDYAADIVSVHIKDIARDVLQQGVEAAWDYGQFSEAGIFAELGEGCVDFPAIFAILRAAGYEGWIIVETDRTTKATAFESAKISRAYLASLGL
ncbi:MAG: TIM barrel protein [Anaerolineae bacterium]|nr:TIM barrel protein [Anaerolineae bacterium]